MEMPSIRAAWMTRVPAGTSIGRPSISSLGIEAHSQWAAATGVDLTADGGLATICTASTGQAWLHMSHDTHLARSMWCCTYGVTLIASVGHAWAHRVQPMQSSLIVYWMNAVHFLAGQRPAMWASYSSRKYFSVESTGLGAVVPSPHRLPVLMKPDMSSSRCRSPARLLPTTRRSMMSSMRFVPTRHGVHLPHDSSCMNRRK